MNRRVKGAALALLAVLTGALLLSGGRPAEPTLPQATDTAVARPLDDSTRRIYILREYQGRVALFAPGQELPFELTQIRVTSLPYADQAALQRGMVLRGEEALRSTLEDFGS